MYVTSLIFFNVMTQTEYQFVNTGNCKQFNLLINHRDTLPKKIT